MNKSKNIMENFLKKFLNVPKDWDKHDYKLHRYSFEDVMEALWAYENQSVDISKFEKKAKQIIDEVKNCKTESTFKT